MHLPDRSVIVIRARSYRLTMPHPEQPAMKTAWALLTLVLLLFVVLQGYRPSGRDAAEIDRLFRQGTPNADTELIIVGDRLFRAGLFLPRAAKAAPQYVMALARSGRQPEAAAAARRFANAYGDVNGFYAQFFAGQP
jgi:hypothetical protein